MRKMAFESALLAKRTQEALGEFRKGVEKVYGKRLERVVLFGSWARGDATQDSDIDVLVVLAGKVVPGKEIDRMIDVITEVNLTYGVLVAVNPVSARDYASLKSPLLMNVRREGKVA